MVSGTTTGSKNHLPNFLLGSPNTHTSPKFIILYHGQYYSSMIIIESRVVINDVFTCVSVFFCACSLSLCNLSKKLSRALVTYICPPLKCDEEKCLMPENKHDDTHLSSPDIMVQTIKFILTRFYGNI